MVLSRNALEERITPARVGKAIAVTLFGTLITGTLLVSVANFGGPVHSVESAVGSLALEVAGVDRFIVVGYVGIGIVRLYLTALPLALFVLGACVAVTGHRLGYLGAVLISGAAAGTVTVLSGCQCGSGSAGFLIQLSIESLVDGPVLAY